LREKTATGGHGAFLVVSRARQRRIVTAAPDAVQKRPGAAALNRYNRLQMQATDRHFRPHPRRRRARRVLLVVALLMWLGTAVWNTYKPLPSGLHVEGEWQAVEAAELRFLADVTGADAHGQPLRAQEIFDATLAMIAGSRDFLVLDYFLFNEQGGPAGELDYARGLRPIARQMRQALLERRRASPDMPILLIVDPINGYYETRLPPEWNELREAGVQIISTDLDRLRDSNALYSAFWRLGLKWWLKQSAPGWLPNLLDDGGPKLPAGALARLVNFKANHRKVILTGDGHGSLRGIVGSANPHDASSAHSNVAVVLAGPALRPLLHSELEVAKLSGWTGAIALPAAITASPIPEATRAAVVTEGAIRTQLLQRLDAAGPAEHIDIAMFYLSDRGVIDSLVDAAARGARVRLILDPNKDAFGFEKSGLPNRPVANELRRRSHGAIQIRWFLTHGEQFHSKITSISDGRRLWTLLGSANYTRRNLEDFNLEANVMVEAPLTGAYGQSVSAWFDSLWNNRAASPATYTGEAALYEDDSSLRYWLYRLMEHSGLSTF
jgi:hypothetical protein